MKARMLITAGILVLLVVSGSSLGQGKEDSATAEVSRGAEMKAAGDLAERVYLCGSEEQGQSALFR